MAWQGGALGGEDWMGGFETRWEMEGGWDVIWRVGASGRRD